MILYSVKPPALGATASWSSPLTLMSIGCAGNSSLPISFNFWPSKQNSGKLGHAIGGGTTWLRMKTVVTSYYCYTVGICFPFSCEMTTSFVWNSTILALHHVINNERLFIQETWQQSWLLSIKNEYFAIGEETDCKILICWTRAQS